MYFVGQKCKITKTTNQKGKHKSITRAGNRTKDLLHRSLQRPPGLPSQHVDCSQAIKLFQRNRSKHKKAIFAGHTFSIKPFFVIF